jgi:hypothetical protein
LSKKHLSGDHGFLPQVPFSGTKRINAEKRILLQENVD